MSDTTPDATPAPLPNQVFPTFTEKARHLVKHHPPQSYDVGDMLDMIRAEFDELICNIGPAIPEGPDATRAAYAVRDACQACIAAVVLNQAPT